MPTPTREILHRFDLIVSGWGTLRPTKSFAGMTLAQFKSKVQPAIDTRTRIRNLESELTAALNQRDVDDVAANDAIQMIVNAVKGDPAEGPDGEVYESFGYVRKSERRTGLRRSSSAVAAPAK